MSATTALATSSPLQLALEKRGIDQAQWNTLANSLFPGAKPDSVLLVIDYCKARRLDPMKKPCHIVPMKVKQGDEYVWRDVVLPGIYEYRTTAVRTGLYLGHTAPVYGDVKEYAGVQAPEWCSMTFKRLGPNGLVIEFPVTVYFREVCNTKEEWVDKKRTGRIIANDRWAKAPFQMLTKTCEAAGLREAFPDEFGGEQTAEEMDGQAPIDVTPVPPVRPAQRLSQVPVTEPEPEPEPPATAPEDAPAHVGQVVEVQDKGNGAAMLVLSTGFRASTKDAVVVQAAVGLRDRKALVELVTTPSSDPSKYAPKVTEIVVIESGEVAAS